MSWQSRVCRVALGSLFVLLAVNVPAQSLPDLLLTAHTGSEEKRFQAIEQLASSEDWLFQQSAIQLVQDEDPMTRRNAGYLVLKHDTINEFDHRVRNWIEEAKVEDYRDLIELGTWSREIGNNVTAAVAEFLAACRPQLRVEALTTIGSRSTQEYYLIGESWRGSRDWTGDWARASVIEYSAKWPNDLVKAIDASDDARVTAGLLHGLLAVEPALARKAVTKALRSPDANLLIAGMYILQYLRNTSDVPLIRSLTVHEDPDVAYCASLALADLSDGTETDRLIATAMGIDGWRLMSHLSLVHFTSLGASAVTVEDSKRESMIDWMGSRLFWAGQAALSKLDTNVRDAFLSALEKSASARGVFKDGVSSGRQGTGHVKVSVRPLVIGH